MVYFEEILGIVHAVIVMDNVPVYGKVRESFPDPNINFLSPCSPFFLQIEKQMVFKSFTETKLQ